MANSAASQGWRDILRGLGQLPLALWLANEDMRGRYARTALGPLWNVIGTAAMVFAIGLTFGVIMRADLSDFLPYIAASVAVWGFISGVIQDGPGTFSRNAGIINVYSLPMTVHVYRSVIDKMIMLFHFLFVYAALVFIFSRYPGMALAHFPVSLVVYFVFGVGVSLTLGVWGARFRDLTPALAAVMTIMFLLTPIFWMKEAVASHPWITDFNPLYHLLEIGRGPLLGYLPTAMNWQVSIASAVGAAILGTLVFSADRRSTLYWI